MKHRSFPIWIALILIFATATVAVHAEDSLAPETARRLKDATVYVKVDIGPLSISGSGFVIQAAGDSALIVTNQHVVTKPKILAAGGFIPGLRGRDRITLMRIQRLLAANEPVVSVVFNSGEPNEQVAKAEVLCSVEDPDLAVLKVSSLKSVPRPVEFGQTIGLSETMPVLLLGFPFGETLASNKANPNITIGKGSVSSIRRDKAGKVVKIQIDGALNPGNSGGPVVDGKGNLVGIAVQSIQGSNIGMAIPAGEVNSILAGSLGKPSITATAAVNGTPPQYHILVPVIDPLKKLKSASVQFVLKSIPTDPSRIGQSQLDSEKTSRKIALPLQGPVARVPLPLNAKGEQPVKEVTVQESFVNGEGKTVYLEPQIVTVPAQVTVTRTTDGKGTTTTTETRVTGNGGQSTRRTTITRGGSSGKPAAAGGKNSSVKVGDKVLVNWAGKVETAEVLEIAASGWIKVKFPRDGIELTPTLPPGQIKPVAEKKKAPAGATLRTWSSKGKKFTVKAKFVELDQETLTLEKENGETMTIPLNKLTEADQKQARQLAEELEDNPFATKPETD